MENEFEKEKIGLLKTEMSQLWNSVFITAGGTIAFLLSRNSFLHILLGIAGIVLTVLFLNAYMIRRIEATKLINNLKERKNNV